MSDVTFDILIRSQADAAAVERMRGTMRSFKGELAGVNEMLARNSNNFALSGFGDRLDITKIKASSESLGKMAKGASDLDGGVLKSVGSLVGFTSVLGVVGTAVATASSYFFSLNSNVHRFSEEIMSAKSRVGTTVEGFQTLTQVLRENGQSPEALTSSLDRLNQVVGDAGNGAEPAAAALAKVGLTANSLKGLSKELQLELVSRGLFQIADESTRAAAAADLLGRGYSQLNPLLKSLATDGYGALLSKSSEANTLLGSKTVEEIDELGTRAAIAGKRAAVAWSPFSIKIDELKASVLEFLPLLADPMTIASRDLSTGKLKSPLPSVQEVLDAGPKNNSVSPEKPNTPDPSIAAAEEAARRELDAAAAKKRDEYETSLEIARAAARKAELQATIESGNAIYLKSEEEKRTLALKTKLVAAAQEEKRVNAELNQQVEKRADIEADWSRTISSKRPELIKSLEAENALIEERIRLLNIERDTADPIRKGDIDLEIGNLTSRKNEIKRKLKKPNPNSYEDQLGSSITSFQDSIGTVPEQIGRGFGSMADSMRSSMQGAFADMILTAQSGSQIIQGFGLAIGQAFISNMAGMVADWIMSHIIMENIRRIFNIKRVAEEGVTQGALTTTHTIGETTRLGVTAGTMGTETGIVVAGATEQATATGIAGVFRSIMELGPIAGPLVMGASIAGMLALVMAAVGGIGKHADGTIIRGPGTQTSDSILTRLSNGEAVIPANRVAQYGPNFIQDLIDGRAISSGRVSEPQESSQALAGVGSVTQVSIFNHVDEATGMAWLNKRPGRKVVNRMMRDSRSDTGQPT